jgi:hypothetical protein
LALLKQVMEATLEMVLSKGLPTLLDAKPQKREVAKSLDIQLSPNRHLVNGMARVRHSYALRTSLTRSQLLGQGQAVDPNSAI